MVTACQPADLSACIWAANSSAGTYRPGNGAPAGGGLITWYMSTGTVAFPGLPVPVPCTVEPGAACRVRPLCTLTVLVKPPVEAAFDAGECDEPPPPVAANATAPAATITTSRAPIAIRRARRARA